MDEFLSCLDYNKNNEIITASNFYTYEKWDSYLTCFNETDFINSDFFVSNPYGKPRQKIDCNICDVQWLTDKDVLVATSEGSLQLFEYNSKESKFTDLFYKREHDDRINCMSVDTSGETVLTGSQDNYIKLWDIKSELSIRTYRAHRHGVVAIEFSPHDSKMFISCSQDNTALLWDLKKQTKPAWKLNIGEAKGHPSCVSWSNVDKNIFTIGTSFGFCLMFDQRNLTHSLSSVKLHDRLIRKVLLNNRLVATCSEDTLVKVSKLSESNELGVVDGYAFDGHKDYVVDGLWNPNKEFELVTCSWEGLIKKHDLRSFA